VTAIREPLAEANAFHQQHGWCLSAAERGTLEALQRNTVNALSQLFATGRGTGMRLPWIKTTSTGGTDVRPTTRLPLFAYTDATTAGGDRAAAATAEIGPQCAALRALVEQLCMAIAFPPEGQIASNGAAPPQVRARGLKAVSCGQAAWLTIDLFSVRLLGALR